MYVATFCITSIVTPSVSNISPIVKAYAMKDQPFKTETYKHNFTNIIVLFVLLE